MFEYILLTALYLMMGVVSIIAIWPNEDLSMKTYTVVSKDGRTLVLSARSYSDAYEQAVAFCGDDLIESFEED